MTDRLAMLEEQMARQRLSVYPPTLDSDRLAMPPMVSIFVKLTRGELFPTQERFLACVAAEDDSLPRAAVNARATRAYPSLVRQLHFMLMLQTRTRLEGVHWWPELDMRGVDLLVLHQGKQCGIALSLATNNARDWGAIKQQRHPDLAGLHMLHLNVDMADPRTRKVGPFFVHPLSDVWRVQEELGVSTGVPA